ncbi:LOW QUALITY PROTEIN: GATA transcription factor 27-like [Phoenix dactylifera]|uniref:LOW QUALITY PROTEIN: GATA transcription factor 27-like n=1 Tax=Phoenix dactylifera TaxID=42345 RepID=A0A8B7BVD4_PHODC|nr:LOW QUALITY PROTEIN: GATA transcription factor 27-like [Phoenix dactylifera]
MAKHGPCCHCGVTSTPLWRNGPPDKPVLCNACGSRWRTKGSLTNYTPMHAREPIDSEELKVTKAKSISLKPKEQKLHKKKQSITTLGSEREIPYSDQNFRKIVDGDTSNRSSSGSAISYSESCAHFGTTDASDMTGSAQSNVWDPLVPSKKRTGIARPKPSPVEKLTKDLYTILHDQQSSYQGSSEGDLLYESRTPMGSFEIGYGSVLIRHPNSKSMEEESEASSLPVDNKSYIINEAYSGIASFSVHNESKGISPSDSGNDKKSTAQVVQENARRDKCSHDKLQILQDRESPLCSTDLQDVINFEEFTKYLTHEEQQRLMKYLPYTDTVKPPESLQSMFSSPHFVESLSHFQQLLLEGIFDLSFSGSNIEECRTLKKFVLLNLTKFRWVEYYKQLKDVKCKQITEGKGMATRPKFPGFSNSASLKRTRDGQNQNYPDLKETIRSSKRMCKSGSMNLLSGNQPQLNSCDAGSKLTDDADDFIENEEACFSPRSFFVSPPDRSSMVVPLQFSDDSTDHDLLLDVPCNASFPEAELLYHPWKQKITSSSSPAENGIAQGEESLSNFPSSFSNKQPKNR